MNGTAESGTAASITGSAVPAVKRGRPVSSPSTAGTRGSRDALVVTAAASLLSVAALVVCYRHDLLLLYGDAVAHINIARRVFDSRHPSPLQLGTVWLPLPHLLMLPFVVSGWMWRTGVSGAIPSMAAYVAATLGVFRLVKSRASRPAAFLAAAFFALNPNVLYMQATAMTEVPYLAFFVWALIGLDEFVRYSRREDAEHRAQAARWLQISGALLAACMLTRYDGWFDAFFFALAAGTVFVKRGRELPVPRPQPAVWRALRNFLLLTGLVAAFWLAYNYGVYGNPLEFANGPYSARAIAARTAAASWHHPGWHSLGTSAHYYLKAARLNVGGSLRGEAPLFWLAVAGSLLGAIFGRKFGVWLLLWLPLPFYSVSIAYESVPVYLPVWWPFSYFNVRYGLELLPAIAVFAALLFEFAGSALGRARWRRTAVVLGLAIAVLSYLAVWRETPICLREARANSRDRIPFEKALAAELARLPSSATILMYAGSHPGALMYADIPLRRTINESDHPDWEQALRAPARGAGYVVAMDGDPVAAAVAAHPEGLTSIATVALPGAPRTILYKSLASGPR